MSDEIKSTVKHYENVSIIAFSGPLTIKTIQSAEVSWNEVLKAKPEVLALDLSDVVFIDSSAISGLVRLLNHTVSRNTKMILYNINPSIKVVIDTVRLSKFFTILTKQEFESAYRISN